MCQNSTNNSHGFGKPQINLCRMRLGMSGLNQHLFKFNIIYSCSCPHCINTAQSPTHFLINCPQYAAERDRMFKAVLKAVLHVRMFITLYYYPIVWTTL
jgi:hypothetical protein